VFDAGGPGTTGTGTSTTGADAPSADASDSLDASLGSEAGTTPDGSADAAPADAMPDVTVTPQEPHKFVGNITTRGQVRPDFIDYWDQITPENEGKWGSVEPNRDQMNWGPLDAAYEYAQQHGIPFKQHTFVWGSQEPGWVAGLSPQEQREEVEEWIRLYCERYPDTQMIDVVNEPPPHTTPSYMNAIGGAGESGWDWIVQSFRWARQYCPNATLILNDYNNVEYPNDNAHFIDITKRVLAAGAPVDAVGVQSHDAHKLSTERVRMYLDRIASETGLPIYVSEYDISVANDDEQRRIMASQFEMFWRHEDVIGITLWGYVEGATWLPNTGLIAAGGQPRPAMTWLMDFLDQER